MHTTCVQHDLIPLGAVCVPHQEPIPDEQCNPQDIEDLPDTDLHLDGTYSVNYKQSNDLLLTSFYLKM